MRCPQCGSEESRVIDSRPSENTDSIRRRRECEACHFRFTTYERREELPLQVVKKDGTKEPFDRQKLMRSLVTATVKRNIDIDQLDQLIDSVEADVRDAGGTEVKSAALGDIVLKRLLELDKVAYVRFASVYKDFKDIEAFSEELRSMAQ